MPYQGFTVPMFGGIDLSRDPQEVGATGAIDLLNVDSDREGRVRTRDGYGAFLSVAAGRRLRFLTSYYTTAGDRYLVANAESAGAGDELVAYSINGVSIATQDFPVVVGQGARIGTPTAERVYFPVPSTSDTFLYLAGTAFATGAGGKSGYHMTVSPVDNRLVVGNITTTGSVDPSRVWFSNDEDPDTFSANNYVSITPGDGEQIAALVTWREFVFAFKETKFAVFYGTSTASDGSPEFNYRMVNAGSGPPLATAAGLARGGTACAGRPGVFYINNRGVYMTTGDVPRLISSQLDPLFLGTAASPYSGSAINQAYLYKAAMHWAGERLYVAVPTGASIDNDRLLVWDGNRDHWTVWNVAAGGLASFKATNDSEDIYFSYAAGANQVGHIHSSFTTDASTAIASHYQSGFYDLGNPGAVTHTRWTRLWGSGSPTVDIYTDHATSDPLSRGGAVTLGTAPAVAEGYHLKSYKGQLFSHKISASSGAWSVNRLQHDIAFSKQT